ncbi:MAG: hypothetical protein J0L97_00455, partial [Alphaproteobacteria bacterium]|nr:hypothetical protein [Alphaproteobacteria bacterium]
MTATAMRPRENIPEWHDRERKMFLRMDHFRAQHAEILGLIAGIRRLMKPAVVRKKTFLVQGAVSELVNKTLAHLIMEDRWL